MPPASKMPPEFIYSGSRGRSRSFGDASEFIDDSQIQNKIEMRLKEIDKLRIERKHIEERDEAREATITALGKRAFHLPENKSWCEDWRAYLSNNHPFFGIFCRWGISPISFGERIVGMAISILIGITVTNCAILWGLMDETMNQEIVSVSFTDEGKGLDVSLALLILWTGVACLHAIHDSLIWYFWCTGVAWGYFLWLFLWVGAGILISAVVSEKAKDDYDPINVIVNAGIEVGFSWLLWYPLVATIIFSGVLGCMRFPVLGGRPRQVHIRQMELQRRRENVPMNTMASLADYDADTIAISRTMSP